ncbi:T9SS type A sorting domain-containing protein [Flavobacterium sp.]|uniref:T9SS type A sorting domain-containing protein n=1 Tax=Flavobacterium sp. TaxID=239 RepID=UPI002619A93B|nr:T9SS type A sorting domain-containing protein [Flavobacterium sp.]
MIKKYLFGIAFVAFSNFALSQQSPLVHGSINAPAYVCDPGACVTLTAALEHSRQTTDYTVNPIVYQSLFPYTGGIVIPPVDDDVFGPAFALPFNFCFYGNTYSSIYIGTNGVISFSAPTQGVFCPWQFSGSIPNESFPIKNAIYGVYQDTDIQVVGDDLGAVINPSLQNVNYYAGGEAPNRYIVINFNELPSYYCGAANLQTSQVILYESSNIIDVYIKNRTSCGGWNNGVGVIGIQNEAGTLATVPANRNTGNWDTANEAWRFLPNGDPTTAMTYQWSKNGVYIPNEVTNTITICDDVPGVYDVSISFIDCGGTEKTVSAMATVESGMMDFNDPLDLSVCADQDTAVFDLTSNIPLMLNAVNPDDYEVLFYHSLMDALNYAPTNIPQADAMSYVGMDGEEIYIRITNLASAFDCPAVESFALNIEPFAVTPDGASNQDFVAGETLADLEVTGDNITWWDAPEAGNELPETTPMVDGATYYAEATNENGCSNAENRMAAQRLAVTVTQVTLGNADWSKTALTVAPNPVKDVLSVNSAQTITSLSVYNLIGQRVLNSFPGTLQAQINLSGFPAGTYLMKVLSGNKVKTVKLVKE